MDYYEKFKSHEKILYNNSFYTYQEKNLSKKNSHVNYGNFENEENKTEAKILEENKDSFQNEFNEYLTNKKLDIEKEAGFYLPKKPKKTYEKYDYKDERLIYPDFIANPVSNKGNYSKNHNKKDNFTSSNITNIDNNNKNKSPYNNNQQNSHNLDNINNKNNFPSYENQQKNNKSNFPFSENQQKKTYMILMIIKIISILMKMNKKIII